MVHCQTFESSLHRTAVSYDELRRANIPHDMPGGSDLDVLTRMNRPVDPSLDEDTVAHQLKVQSRRRFDEDVTGGCQPFAGV